MDPWNKEYFRNPVLIKKIENYILRKEEMVHSKIYRDLSIADHLIL